MGPGLPAVGAAIGAMPGEAGPALCWAGTIRYPHEEHTMNTMTLTPAAAALADALTADPWVRWVTAREARALTRGVSAPMIGMIVDRLTEDAVAGWVARLEVTPRGETMCEALTRALAAG